MKVYGIVTIMTELELRTVEDTPVLNFLVSFTESVGKGESKKTVYHSISAELWAGAATYLASKCRKGDKLYIEGLLRQNRWVDSEGVKHHRNMVRVQNFQLMSSYEQVEN